MVDVDNAVPPRGAGAEWTDRDLESAIVGVKGYVPASTFGVVVQDTAGAIVACTEAAERILGQSFDQMRGRTSQDPRWSAVSADGQPIAGDEHPSMITLRTGKAQRDVLMGVQRGSEPAASYVWITIDTHLIPRDAGHPPGAVISCFTPVEEARADELRLAQSERMFRMITERSQELVGIHTLTGTWLWASPATDKVLGYQPEDLLGNSMFEVIVDEDLDAARRALTRVLQSGEPVTVLLRARHRSGAIIWVEVIGQQIVDDDGTPYQLQTSTRDVTPRIAAEQARDAAVEVFTTVMENSPIGMAVHDLAGRIRTTNRALQEMVCCRDDELIGSSLVDRVHPADRPTIAAEVAAMVEGDQTFARREARFELPDRSVIWVESTTVVLRAFDGTPTGFLEQLHDVTARKHAEAELERRATSDPLTGLPNRTRFHELLDAAIRDAEVGDPGIAVLFIDIDGFKTVNDTHGHPVGDELLREVGKRLTRELGETGIATRYGGDEFAVMFRVGSDEIDMIVDGVRGALGEPFIVNDVILPLTASVGVASGAGETADDLLREADRSMYLVKRAQADPVRDGTEPTH